MLPPKLASIYSYTYLFFSCFLLPCAAPRRPAALQDVFLVVKPSKGLYADLVNRLTVKDAWSNSAGWWSTGYPCRCVGGGPRRLKNGSLEETRFGVIL